MRPGSPAIVRGVERVDAPATGPRVLTEFEDTLGRPVTVGCPTCHSLPGFGHPDRRTGEPLKDFHRALVTDHGQIAGLRCISCHAPGGYGSLHLADGRLVSYVDATLLCRQCHGPQARDFDHGAHGGVNGHWDLRYGDRTRHACTVCHDPHSPAYAPMQPAPGPWDPSWTRGDRRASSAHPASEPRNEH